MRAGIANVVFAAATLAACSKSENAGAEEAKKQAEAELKAKVESGGAAVKIKPPVPGQQTVAWRDLQVASTSSGSRCHQLPAEKISTSCAPR